MSLEAVGEWFRYPVCLLRGEKSCYRKRPELHGRHFMTPAARIQAAIEILEQLHGAWQLKRPLPVDALFADYFRSHRYMGSKDRAAVSDLVYFALRNGGAIEWHLEQANKVANPRRVILLAAWFSSLAGEG